MVSFFDGFGAGFALVFARGSATRISRVAHGGFKRGAVEPSDLLKSDIWKRGGENKIFAEIGFASPLGKKRQYCSEATNGLPTVVNGNRFRSL